MAKRKNKSINISKKNLGYGLFAALIIQHVLPAVKLGSLGWIATVIYLLIAIYLTFF